MPDSPQNPTQQTRPKGIDKKTGKRAKPAEIPVPTRREVFDLMRSVSGPRSVSDDAKQ